MLPGFKSLSAGSYFSFRWLNTTPFCGWSVFSPHVKSDSISMYCRHSQNEQVLRCLWRVAEMRVLNPKISSLKCMKIARRPPPSAPLALHLLHSGSAGRADSWKVLIYVFAVFLLVFFAALTFLSGRTHLDPPQVPGFVSSSVPLARLEMTVICSLCSHAQNATWLWRRWPFPMLEAHDMSAIALQLASSTVQSWKSHCIA